MKEIILEYLETSEPETFFEYAKKLVCDQNVGMRNLSRIKSELIRMWKIINKKKYNRLKFL